MESEISPVFICRIWMVWKVAGPVLGKACCCILDDGYTWRAPSTRMGSKCRCFIGQPCRECNVACRQRIYRLYNTLAREQASTHTFYNVIVTTAATAESVVLHGAQHTYNVYKYTACAYRGLWSRAPLRVIWRATTNICAAQQCCAPLGCALPVCEWLADKRCIGELNKLAETMMLYRTLVATGARLMLFNTICYNRNGGHSIYNSIWLTGLLQLLALPSTTPLFWGTFYYIHREQQR